MFRNRHVHSTVDGDCVKQKFSSKCKVTPYKRKKKKEVNKHKMKKWEYKYIKCKKGKGILSVSRGVNEEQLNELGKEGWELVSTLQFDMAGTQVAMIFKRELKK